MEEDLFESENIRIDLLEKILALENAYSFAEEKIQELLDLNE